jgi:uncharacterized protein (DUF433 family)
MTNRLAARVTSDGRIMMGKPVIKGARIPVKLILRRLGDGDREQQIQADYPRLGMEDIRAEHSKRGQISNNSLPAGLFCSISNSFVERKFSIF